MAAKMYITEFAGALPLGNDASMLMVPAVVDQMVNTSASSAQSAAFNANTKVVRIHVDGIVSIKFGDNPTALTNNHRMAANTTEYFAVKAGQKVAGIDNT